MVGRPSLPVRVNDEVGYGAGNDGHRHIGRGLFLVS